MDRITLEQENGAGKSLVLLHDASEACIDLMRSVSESLSSTFRVLIFECHDISAQGLPELVNELEACFHEAGLKGFTLAGTRLSSILVQCYALSHAERLRSLLLLDPVTSIAGGFDSRSFLQQICRPVLVVSTQAADRDSSVACLLMSERIPACWVYQASHNQSDIELACIIRKFIEVPSHVPQRQLVRS